MKLRAPSWSRIRPNPATATIQAPANLGDVQAVAGVVLQVVEIHESGLGEVVIRVDVGADRYSDRPEPAPVLTQPLRARCDREVSSARRRQLRGSHRQGGSLVTCSRRVARADHGHHRAAHGNNAPPPHSRIDARRPPKPSGAPDAAVDVPGEAGGSYLSSVERAARSYRPAGSDLSGADQPRVTVALFPSLTAGISGQRCSGRSLEPPAPKEGPCGAGLGVRRRVRSTLGEHARDLARAAQTSAWSVA